MAQSEVMDRNLALEAVRVTEAAALSASRLMGRGDEKAADQAAVDAMRRELNRLPIDGKIVIGEGERDEAPMLYIGEKVGVGQGPRVDIALDPLEGTTLTAKAMPNALAVVAFAPGGGLLNPPDTYMDKIAANDGTTSKWNVAPNTDEGSWYLPGVALWAHTTDLRSATLGKSNLPGLQNLTITDLQRIKDPYGRQAIAYMQSIGTLWGLT